MDSVSAEIEVIEPLDVAAATRLDKRIRLMAATVRDNLTKTAELVEEAKAGQIHVALGFSSWTAYLADAIGGQIELGTESRRAVVELLAGEGMSNRAIAAAVGVSHPTVAADLAAATQVVNHLPPDGDSAGSGDSGDVLDRGVLDPRLNTPTVTGLDGKNYKKSGTKKKPTANRPSADEILLQSDELCRKAAAIVADLFAAATVTAEPIEEESDGDTYTLWSPDVTITVTSRIGYEDLRPWVLSLYEHASLCECHNEWGYGPNSSVDPVDRCSKWLSNVDDNPEFDVFGATILYLDPLYLIANMATWMADYEDGEDSIAVAKRLIEAYEMWDWRVAKSITNTAVTGGDW